MPRRDVGKPIETKEMQSLELKVKGASWTIFQKDAVWSGASPGSTGTFWYQLEGYKVLCVCSVTQLLDVTLTKLVFAIRLCEFEIWNTFLMRFLKL